MSAVAPSPGRTSLTRRRRRSMAPPLAGAGPAITAASSLTLDAHHGPFPFPPQDHVHALPPLPRPRAGRAQPREDVPGNAFTSPVEVEPGESPLHPPLATRRIFLRRAGHIAVAVRTRDKRQSAEGAAGPVRNVHEIKQF